MKLESDRFGVGLTFLRRSLFLYRTIRPALTYVKLEDGSGSGRRRWFVVTELISRPCRRCEIIKTRFDCIKGQPSPLAVHRFPIRDPKSTVESQRALSIEPSMVEMFHRVKKKKKKKKKRRKEKSWMNAVRDIAIWLCSFEKKKRKKKKNHRGHARLFARWGSRIIRVWSV